MESNYLSIIKKAIATYRNYSLISTVVTAKETNFDPVNRSQRKQLFIFLALFVVLTSFLAITGCATPQQAFPSRSLLTNTSKDSTNNPSEGQQVITSPDSLPDIIYRTSKVGQTTRSELSTAKTSKGSSTTVDTDRLVRLDHEIGFETIAAANDLLALADKSDSPIEVYIDSPGGSVYAGLTFIEAMDAVKARGIKIRCHVPNFAASMAFVIFTQCTERFALPYAQLLFHPPRIGGMFLLTPQAAAFFAQRLSQIEAHLINLIGPPMGIDGRSAKWFMTNYINETLFFAKDLLEQSPAKWYTVVNRMEAK